MASDNSFRTNQDVKWKWGENYARGQIEERFEKKVTRTIDGNEVTRDGSGDNPAYLIKQEDGQKVLKKGSELEADPQD